MAATYSGSLLYRDGIFEEDCLEENVIYIELVNDTPEAKREELLLIVKEARHKWLSKRER